MTDEARYTYPTRTPKQPRQPKFKVGQVLIFDRGFGKKKLSGIVLELTEDGGEYFYRLDSKNFLHEPMLRSAEPTEER